MKIPQTHRAGVGFNMTPMIDVVFLLIIFFLVSSHLAKQERRLKLDLAQAGAESLAPPTDRVINVERSGRLHYAGRVVSEQQLEDQLRVATAGPVYLRADQAADYRHVAAALRACALAGRETIDIGVTKEKARN